MALICISLIANNFEHLFMYLFAINISSLVNYLSMSFEHFLIEYFLLVSFFLLSFKSSLYILEINPLPDTWFANIFSQSVACLFIPLSGSFIGQIFKILMRSNLLHFAFGVHTFSVKAKGVLSNPRS